jgi:hypothetical protein
MSLFFTKLNVYTHFVKYRKAIIIFAQNSNGDDLHQQGRAFQRSPQTVQSKLERREE